MNTEKISGHTHSSTSPNPWVSSLFLDPLKSNRKNLPSDIVNALAAAGFFSKCWCLKNSAELSATRKRM